MDFQDVVRRRRMVRQFTADPVPQHSLDRILANAVRGPSAGFCQGQAFLVLTGDDLPRFWALAGEATRPAVHTAPLVIVPLSCQRIYIDAYVQQDPSWADESRWPMPWWHLDTAMAALLILLTAVDEGLGAVYFGIVDHETRALRTEFGIPDDHQPIGAIALGHDAEPERTSLASRRRPFAEMIHYGQMVTQAVTSEPPIPCCVDDRYRSIEPRRSAVRARHRRPVGQSWTSARTAAMCAGARRSQVALRDGLPVSLRPRRAEFTAPD